MLKVKEVDSQKQTERRQYPRLPFRKNVWFRVCMKNVLYRMREGITVNVSQVGMLFFTRFLPPISALVLLELDLEALSQVVQVDGFLLQPHQYILGKVIRVHREGEDSLHEVGISFVREEDRDRPDVQEALTLIQ